MDETLIRAAHAWSITGAAFLSGKHVYANGTRSPHVLNSAFS